MSRDGSGAQPDTAVRVSDVMRIIGDAYLVGRGRTLVMVRHGEAAHVTAGDHYDPPLSMTGRSQAAAVASRLEPWSGGRKTALFTSPRRRTMETAAAIAERLGLPPEVEPGLAEVGEKGAPIPVRLPDTSAGLARFNWDVPDSSFKPTAIVGVETTLGLVDADLVIAVTHGGVINAYASHLLGLDCEFFFLPAHTSLTVVRVDDGRVALDRLNDAGHVADS